MRHLVPALLLFTLALPIHSQTASLPDAPSAQLQPQAQTPSSSALVPSTPPRPIPDHHWLRVEQLPPGKAIAVLQYGHGYPTSCNVNLANDTTLTCTEPMPYSLPRRLVFPIGNIASVFTEEVTFEPSRTAILVKLGIGAAIGAALGVGVCNEAPARDILACSLVGAGIGGAVVFAPPETSTPPRYPRPPHIRRRLIYRAP